MYKTVIHISSSVQKPRERTGSDPLVYGGAARLRNSDNSPSSSKHVSYVAGVCNPSRVRPCKYVDCLFYKHVEVYVDTCTCIFMHMMIDAHLCLLRVCLWNQCSAISVRAEAQYIVDSDAFKVDGSK